MKSKAVIFCFFCVILSQAQKSNGLTIRILNKKIVENQNVDFIIENNSKENFYILIDTLFIADAKFDNDYFANPYFVLVDKKNNEVPKISHISESGKGPDLNQINESFSLIEIKSKQNLFFSLKFKIKRDISVKQSNYFMVDRTEKYFASIKYKLTQMFVEMGYVKKRIDALKKNNFKVFVGTIESNKCPIAFEK